MSSPEQNFFENNTNPNYNKDLDVLNKILKPIIHVQQFATSRLERGIYFPKEAVQIQRMFPEAQSMLDIGSGLGYFGDAVKKQMPTINVFSSDIENRHKGIEPFVVADSNKLPFPNNSFDLVSLMYVLHHTEDPTTALQEAARVCRGSLIIQEDTYSNTLQKAFYQFHLNSYRLTIASNGLYPRTDQEWEGIFEIQGLQMQAKRNIKKIVGYPVRRYEYILRPVISSSTSE